MNNYGQTNMQSGFTSLLPDTSGPMMTTTYGFGSPQYQQYTKGSDSSAYNFLYMVVWFIIIVILIWLILVAIKPDFFMKTDQNGDKTDEVDHGRILVTAVIIAIIICLLIWFLKSCSWGGGSSTLIMGGCAPKPC